MSLTPSTMLPLGTPAPYFSLPDITGKTVTTDDFTDGKGLLVVFMCNHCPYVRYVIDKFAEIAEEYRKKGLDIVGINSNDAETYPDDSPARMIGFAEEHGITFPYLFDETQETAGKYHAACTPDFFLFGPDRKLVYRGQMDGARPGNGMPVTGKDLRSAMDALLENRPVPSGQKPSMGCNIKWKTGREPDYFKT
jgi:peroxiredoxin